LILRPLDARAGIAPRSPLAAIRLPPMK
jgi:hypothetical protein